MNRPTLPPLALLPSKPAADLSNPDYVEDMRSRIGELVQIAHTAPDTSHACTPDKDRAARLRFIDRLDGAHDYLVRLSLELRKEEAAA